MLRLKKSFRGEGEWVGHGRKIRPLTMLFSPLSLKCEKQLASLLRQVNRLSILHEKPDRVKGKLTT